jgi:hypothetical protein
MSTATGPAYAIKTTVNIMEVPDFLEDIRVAQSRAIQEELVENAIFAFDNQNTETVFSDYLKTYISKEVSSKKDLSDFSYHIDSLMNAKLAFYYNKVRNETYVRLIGFTNESVTFFAALPIVDREVSYQNGSDSQLETITEAEWHDRRDLWNELDSRARKYPTVLSVPILEELSARYNLINATSILEVLDTLVLPSYEYRYSRLFVGKYCETLGQTGADLWEVLSYSMNFKYKSDGTTDYTRLYESEKNTGLIATTGAFVQERLRLRKI